MQVVFFQFISNGHNNTKDIKKKPQHVCLRFCDCGKSSPSEGEFPSCIWFDGSCYCTLMSIWLDTGCNIESSVTSIQWLTSMVNYMSLTWPHVLYCQYECFMKTGCKRRLSDSSKKWIKQLVFYSDFRNPGQRKPNGNVTHLLLHSISHPLFLTVR